MTKTVGRIIIGIIIVIIVLFIAIKVGKVQNIFLKKIYVCTYSELVYPIAEENDVDPLLIFAIIKAESNFNPEAVSKSDARGLMQLMKTTAEDVAKKGGITLEDEEDLYDPETNIKLGTMYFSSLMQKYKNVTLALTAYNAGSGNVDKWVENGTIQKDGSDAENIPYKETNNYVRKILRDYEIYQELYE